MTMAAAVASIRSCRRPGSGISSPSRVMKTGRRSPIDATAIRRFSASQTNGADEGDGEQRSLAAQHRREDRLVADLAEPEPVGVEADQRGAGEDQQQERERAR